MSINSRTDEEFTKMPPTEDEPLIKRHREERKSYLAELYERKVKPRVRAIPFPPRAPVRCRPADGPQLTPETLRIMMFFGLLVLFGIANSISGRWNQVKFGDRYAFFNNQVRIRRPRAVCA